MSNTKYIVRLTRVDEDKKRRYGYFKATGTISATRKDAYEFKNRYNAERVAAILGKSPWTCGEVRPV